MSQFRKWGSLETSSRNVEVKQIANELHKTKNTGVTGLVGAEGKTRPNQSDHE